MVGRLEAPEIAIDALAHDGKNKTSVHHNSFAEQQGFSLAICAFPSPDIGQKIHIIAEQIRREFPDHMYAPISSYHLKIAVLGTVATAEGVGQACAKYDDTLRNISANTSSIRILMEGVSHFPDRFFAQAFDESDALDTLHQTLLETCPTPDTTPFVPHITMGYSRGNAYALNRYINKELPWVQLGHDFINTIQLTAFDSRRSILDSPPKVVSSYTLRD